MTIDVNTLESFSGKQVILHKIEEDGTVTELEGKVEAASVGGLAFKEKGKRDVDLILPEQIEEISLAPTKPKAVLQKKLKPVTESNVRQHLVDRHGLLRADVNALTDEAAFEQHEAIDHAPLGHKHVEPDNDSDATEGDENEGNSDEE